MSTGSKCYLHTRTVSTYWCVPDSATGGGGYEERRYTPWLCLNQECECTPYDVGGPVGS